MGTRWVGMVPTHQAGIEQEGLVPRVQPALPPPHSPRRQARVSPLQTPFPSLTRVPAHHQALQLSGEAVGVVLAAAVGRRLAAAAAGVVVEEFRVRQAFAVLYRLLADLCVGERAQRGEQGRGGLVERPRVPGSCLLLLFYENSSFWNNSCRNFL